MAARRKIAACQGAKGERERRAERRRMEIEEGKDVHEGRQE